MIRVIVSYDISDDRIRRSITKVCETFGQRVQRSVFECKLSSDDYKEMCKQLNAARKGPDTVTLDSIRIYTICADCAGKVKVLGYAPKISTTADHIIIG